MKAFSNDLRVRVISVEAAGHSVKDIKKRGRMKLYQYKYRGDFFVSIPTLHCTLIRERVENGT